MEAAVHHNKRTHNPALAPATCAAARRAKQGGGGWGAAPASHRGATHLVNKPADQVADAADLVLAGQHVQAVVARASHLKQRVHHHRVGDDARHGRQRQQQGLAQGGLVVGGKHVQQLGEPLGRQHAAEGGLAAAGAALRRLVHLRLHDGRQNALQVGQRRGRRRSRVRRPVAAAARPGRAAGAALAAAGGGLYALHHLAQQDQDLPLLHTHARR
jgi:hypothetical protein